MTANNRDALTTHANWGEGDPHLLVRSTHEHRTFHLVDDDVSIGSNADATLRLEGIDALPARIVHTPNDEYRPQREQARTTTTPRSCVPAPASRSGRGNWCLCEPNLPTTGARSVGGKGAKGPCNMPSRRVPTMRITARPTIRDRSRRRRTSAAVPLASSPSSLSNATRPHPPPRSAPQSQSVAIPRGSDKTRPANKGAASARGRRANPVGAQGSAKSTSPTPPTRSAVAICQNPAE